MRDRLLDDGFRHDWLCDDCHDSGRAECLGCGGLGCGACEDEGSTICDCDAGEALGDAVEYARIRRCEVCDRRAMVCGSHARCAEHDEERAA